MKEKELENQIAKILEKSLEVAEKTGDFVIDQAPELLQEFYNWHIANNLLGIVFSILALIGVYKVFKLMGTKEKNKDSIWDQGKVLGKWYGVDNPGFVSGTVSLFVISILCLLNLIFKITDLLKIIVAPKIYLIEYFLR